MLVAMSGGVDSSLCAALLLRRGYEAEGLTFVAFDGGEGAARDAAAVCAALGIPHRTLDLRSQFRRAVVEPFIKEYLSGRTPNPCVMCNRAIKFGALFDYAEKNGFDYIATGHYAVISRDEGGRLCIARNPDRSKDQSYVLYTLPRRVLERTLLPLGGMTKAEVRAEAEALGLPAAKKADSQDICFIPDGDYASFILKNTGAPPLPGPITDSDGNILGRHRGLMYYTVGQRKGIGAYGEPMFVLRCDYGGNALVLGRRGEEYSGCLTARDICEPYAGALSVPRAAAKIRYSGEPAPCSLSPIEGGRLRVQFDAPVRAVTPGQAVVFYDGDRVIGGGTIE